MELVEGEELLLLGEHVGAKVERSYGDGVEKSSVEAMEVSFAFSFLKFCTLNV